MLKQVRDGLLQKFCDKSLISKEKLNKEKKIWYTVPSLGRLAPFINPELGYLPPDDEDNDDSDDEDDYDSDSSGLENRDGSSAQLSEENSTLGSKVRESLPGSTARGRINESKHLSKKVVSPFVCRDRSKVKSGPLTDVNNVTCGSDTVGIATRAKVDVQQIVRSYGKMTTRSRNSPIISRMNFNNDEIQLNGSKESPIPILESSDDSTVSSITMSFESNNKITTPSPRKAVRSSRKVITPMQKRRDHMAIKSEHLTNVEDVQWNGIKTPPSRKALRSSRKVITRKKKCRDHDIDEEHLTNVEDVPKDSAR